MSTKSTNSFKPETDEQMLDSARAIDKCLKFLNLNNLDCEIPLSLSEKVVKEALENAIQQGPSFKTMFRLYLNIAVKLFTGNPVDRKRLTVNNVDYQFESFDIQQPLNHLEISKIRDELRSIYKSDNITAKRKKSEAEIRKAFEFKEWKEKSSERMHDGESEDELTPPPTESEEFNMRARLGLYARITRPNGYYPTFSRSYLTLETVSCILSFTFLNFQENAEHLDEYLELLAFQTCQLFFGFDEKLLLNAGVRETSDLSILSEDIPLIYSRDGYFHIRPRKYDGKSPFGKLNAEHEHLYIQGSDDFSLPVPIILRKILAEFLDVKVSSNSKLFNHSNTNKLNILLNPLRLILHQNFDLKKFGNTCVKNLTETGNLDELNVAFISGFIPQHLAAQPHYRNIEVAELSQQHIAACDNLWQKLSIIDDHLPYVLNFSPLRELSDFSCTYEDLTVADVKKKRFGSPFVPLTEVINSYLTELKIFIENCTDPIKRFNCYTVCTALILMFLTGIRACEIGRLKVGDLYLSNNGLTLIIDGKANRFFDEWRLSAFHNALGGFLTEYQHQVKNVLDFIHNGMNIFPVNSHEKINEKLFFFVGDSGDVVQLTSSSFNQKLKKELPLYGNIPEYKYRINAPRQFFATTAADLRIERRLIDALMGHTTRGREPLFKFSDLSFSEIREAGDKAAFHIDELLNFHISQQ